MTKLLIVASGDLSRRVAIHPDNIARVEGDGTNYTVYYIGGGTTTFGGAVDVEQFITWWQAALDGRARAEDQEGSRT